MLADRHLFIFFVIYFKIRCYCLNIGFKTVKEEKFILGDISYKATSYHIAKVREELTDFLAAYLNVINGLPTILRPIKMLKCIGKMDGSVWSLYEVESPGIVRFLKQKLHRYGTLKEFVSIFEKPITILHEIDLPELIELQLSEVITLELMDEIVSNTPDFIESLDLERIESWKQYNDNFELSKSKGSTRTKHHTKPKQSCTIN